MLQAHCGFDSVLGLGAAGSDRCLLVAPWWQTWEHLTCLISALHSSMPVPPMRGHLPCRDTFAWIQKCPLKAGTTISSLISSHIYYIISSHIYSPVSSFISSHISFLISSHIYSIISSPISSHTSSHNSSHINSCISSHISSSSH